MLEWNVNSFQEVFKIGKFTILCAFNKYLLGEYNFYACYQIEAENQALLLQAAAVGTFVDTGCFDLRTKAPRFVDVDFSAVVAAKVVDACSEVGQRIMCFEIQTLVALNCIRCGVSFRKSITRKAFDLLPNTTCKGGFVSSFEARRQETFLNAQKFGPRPEFTRHTAAQDIGLS